MKHRTVLDEQHPLSAARRLCGVRDHKYGLTALVYLAEQRQQLVGAAAVERSGWLVRKEQLGLGYHRASRCGALLLTAGYLVGVFIQQGGYPEQLGGALQLRLHCRVLLAPEHQREQYIIPDGERVQQVEFLENEPKIVPAEIREL